MFNKNDLPHELLLTTRQKTKLRNSFNNNMSTDLKLSKSQVSKIIQSGGFLGRLLGPLLKTRLPLIKNVIKLLAKSVFLANLKSENEEYKIMRLSSVKSNI